MDICVRLVCSFESVFLINGRLSEGGELIFGENEVVYITVLPLDAVMLPYTVKLVGAHVKCNPQLARSYQVGTGRHVLKLLPRHNYVYSVGNSNPHNSYAPHGAHGSYGPYDSNDRDYGGSSGNTGSGASSGNYGLSSGGSGSSGSGGSYGGNQFGQNGGGKNVFSGLVERLFNSVAGGNIDAARRCLSPELSDSIDDASLLGFFDGYVDIVDNERDGMFYLINKNHTGVLCEFVIVGGLIDNIIEQ